MYPYDAIKLVQEAAAQSTGLGAPLLETINNGAKIVGANGDQRGYNAEYHEGVSPADMYFARFEGFMFVPVSDDPLSGALPNVNQLADRRGSSTVVELPRRICPGSQAKRQKPCRAVTGSSSTA